MLTAQAAAPFPPLSETQNTVSPDTQRLMAQTDIGTAWESHKHNGLAFGRQCHEWGEKFKAQGSRHGSTFQEILKGLDIPRHIADYWADKHKASIGQGIPCEHCTETFPSKTQLKKHQHNKHPELFQGTPRAPFVPALPTRTDGSVDVHTTAIAVNGVRPYEKFNPFVSETNPVRLSSDTQEPGTTAARKSSPQPDPEFVRLRNLAKDAGYHLTNSTRADKCDILALSFAESELCILALIKAKS